MEKKNLIHIQNIFIEKTLVQIFHIQPPHTEVAYKKGICRLRPEDVYVVPVCDDVPAVSLLLFFFFALSPCLLKYYVIHVHLMYYIHHTIYNLLMCFPFFASVTKEKKNIKKKRN